MRVGIVGASPDGGWAAGSHVPAVGAAGLRLTAVATSRPESAARAGAAFGVEHAFSDARALAEHPEVDLVVVSVRVDRHAEVVRTALAAGKHVLSEWPLGVDVDEAADLTRAAEDAGVVHAVTLQGYHAPWAVHLADLLAEGRVGRVESVHVVAPGDPFGGPETWPDLVWSTDPAAGGTLLTIMGGHTLGTLDRLVGSPTEVSALVVNRHPEVEVRGTGERVANSSPGQVALIGRLGGGAVLSISLPGGFLPGPDRFSARVVGTAGTLAVVGVDQGAYAHWTAWDVTLRTADGDTRLALPDHLGASGRVEHIAALYREVAAAVAEGRPATPSFHDALRHHRVLDAVQRSSDTGTRVVVDR
ncbi:Gfo/Idh/MocA family protein [Saccharothrix sp. Mg75]|uniref:Gfo/Idh/MocA family protein n=1 Tax=Saccharothrix sp. Mg75 TaxID=3445357 RepID=UPI003EEE4AD9